MNRASSVAPCPLVRTKSAASDEMLMTLPCERSIMTGSTAWQHRNVPRTFAAITRSHASSDVSRKGAYDPMPALFTSTSICPNLSSEACVIARTLSSSRTSHATASASRPSASTSSATLWIVPGSCRRGVSVRPATTTLHPAPASPKAMARPMPRVAPVTMATFPESSKKSVSPSGLRWCQEHDTVLMWVLRQKGPPDTARDAAR